MTDRPHSITQDSTVNPVSVPRYASRICVLTSLLLLSLVNLTRAQQATSLKPTGLSGAQAARVSPVLEIEILDPNKDARGNPAIVTTTDSAGNLQVEIPPSLIVHRYYYTGDRSFRGPDLPGGPSIVIAQHPHTGKQVHLPVQMLPGSPIVHYTARKIEYDFGNRAVIVGFPKLGKPTVSYRNGRPLSEKASKVLGLQFAKATWKGTKATVHRVADKTQTVVQAAGLAAANVARPLTLPAQHVAQLIPGHAALTDPNLEARVREESALNRRALELRRARSESRLNNADITIPR